MTKIKRKKIIRDISWLSFNERVLQEAQDKNVSLYDRLKFLGIYSNNQDEFFRVRVATLTRMVEYGKLVRMYLEDNPKQILSKIHTIVLAQQERFNKTYNSLLREMKSQDVLLINEKKLFSAERKWVLDYFNEEVRTNITPLMIEDIPTGTMLNDDSIYLACILKSSTVKDTYSLIEVPSKVLPRFIILPPRNNQKRIILLEDVIRYCLPNLFSQFGYNAYESYIIKVTRDAELDIDNDVNTDVIKAIEKGLKNRKKGKALRFVYDKDIDKTLLNYLMDLLNLRKGDHLMPGGRVHNFKDFMNFPKEVFEAKSLKEREQFVHPLFVQPVRIMHVLDKQDVMLHLPYHSFDSIIDLLREAAIDPEVFDIKISCYRLAKKSQVINALINAVRNGKKVTVALELRARFNEKDNLSWKNILEDAGVNVLIGLPHQKVHAKVAVITKREKKQIKYYSFISTGNLNESTAKVYSDHYLLSSNKDLAKDILRIFSYLENPKNSSLLKQMNTLIVSPFGTRKYFDSLIEFETRKKNKGEMIIKLNSFSDEKLIQSVYKAAFNQVNIKLIIRGICNVSTSNPAWKKKIDAISIVDKYLEHSRILYFNHDGLDLMYITSADWMLRNLDHRLEVTVPILDKKIKKELKKYLDIQLRSNVKARILDNNQTNKYRLTGRDKELVRSQHAIYDFLKHLKY